MEEISHPEATRPSELEDLRTQLKKAAAAAIKLLPLTGPVPNNEKLATIKLNSTMDTIMQKFQKIRAQLGETPTSIIERKDDTLKIDIPSTITRPGTYQLRLFLDDMEVPTSIAITLQ